MASSTTDLVKLAEDILAASKTVSKFLEFNGHPPPSFAVDAPSEFPPAPDDVLAARETIRAGTENLSALVTGPASYMRWQTWKHLDIAALRWLMHFEIPQAIPLDRAIPFTEVASTAHVDADQCRRILRYAMTNLLFCEPQPEHVAHTAASALLVTSQQIQDYIGHDMAWAYQANSRLVEAMERWGASQEMNETAFNVAHGTDLPMYQFLMQHPEKKHARRFAGMMDAMIRTEGYNEKHTIAGFDWAGVGEGTVVDVGGSTGHVSLAIAEKAPKLNFIVQDLPHVVAQGESALPASMKDRISFIPHDFFTPQPVKDADVYLLRLILHNYSDKYAITILRNLVPALKDGARVVVFDGVMPEPGALSWTEEKELRELDIIMLTHFNGSERELGHWKRVFEQADPRLKFRNVIRPPGSTNSGIELVFEAGEDGR